MKSIKYILASGLVVLILGACSHSRPLMVTDNPSEKTGTSEYKTVLGIFRPMKADISIRTAAENGGISKVSTVDFRVEGNIFSTTYKTVVTGK